MRQVLVDHARRRLSLKRGAGAIALDLGAAMDIAVAGAGPEILALNDALDDLGRVDPRKVKVIELRYFGGCTEEETARILQLSVASAPRDLRATEASLSVHLGADSGQ